MSDGINILFGDGRFGKLRDRGSFGTVSELAELAVKFRDRSIIALKGQNMKAQGNALGKWPNRIPSPEGATYTALGTQSIALASLNSPFQGLFDGDLLPGVALRFHRGLLEFAPSGNAVKDFIPGKLGFS